MESITIKASIRGDAVVRRITTGVDIEFISYLHDDFGDEEVLIRSTAELKEAIKINAKSGKSALRITLSKTSTLDSSFYIVPGATSQMSISADGEFVLPSVPVVVDTAMASSLLSSLPSAPANEVLLPTTAPPAPAPPASATTTQSSSKSHSTGDALGEDETFWTCESCTYDSNSTSRKSCQMCYTNRPSCVDFTSLMASLPSIPTGEPLSAASSAPAVGGSSRMSSGGRTPSFSRSGVLSFDSIPPTVTSAVGMAQEGMGSLHKSLTGLVDSAAEKVSPALRTIGGVVDTHTNRLGSLRESLMDTAKPHLRTIGEAVDSHASKLNSLVETTKPRLMSIGESLERGAGTLKDQLHKLVLDMQSGAVTASVEVKDAIKNLIRSIDRRGGSNVGTSGAVDTSRESLEELREVHIGSFCDGCGATPIVGVRYASAFIEPLGIYNLCSSCEAVHDPRHLLIKVKIPRPSLDRDSGDEPWLGTLIRRSGRLSPGGVSDCVTTSSGVDMMDSGVRSTVSPVMESSQYQEELAQLAGMGFTDSALNQRLLQERAGNVGDVISALINM